MSDEQQIIEVELDPLGYQPRQDLYVRNLTPNTITFNMGRLRWELPPWPNPDYEQSLPWTVAKSPGFERLWEREQVLVATDEDFENTIAQLVGGLTAFRPHIHTQTLPQSVVEIEHDLNRHGPVQLAVFSIDGQTEYYNFHTEMLTKDVCRVSFDDPIPFMATVY